MNDRYYLLALEEFWSDVRGERLLAEALRKVDSSRQKKAERIRQPKARAASVGGGLLLQLALREAAGTAEEKERNADFSVYTVSQALSLIDRPRETVMEYGKNGKPYLRDRSFFFNLSHSGGYVFCALSDREVGADIQICQPAQYSRLAGRFFSEEEHLALEECADEGERSLLFYRLWTRKEAYGKLTGAGLAEGLGRNLLPEAGAQDGSDILWSEWSVPEGYRIAVCRYA